MKDASETQAIESSISVHLIQTCKAHSRGRITLKIPVFNQYRLFSRWERVSAEQEFWCVCVISITDRFIECLPNMAFVQIPNFVQIKRRVCSDRWKNRFIIPHSGPQKNTMKRQGCTFSDSITSLPTIVRKDSTAVFKQLIISQRGSGDEEVQAGHSTRKKQLLSGLS